MARTSMAVRSSSIAVLFVVAWAAVCTVTGLFAFVGSTPAAQASQAHRVALRARGGDAEPVMEILVTSQSTGNRIRFSVPPSMTIGAIKTQGIADLGFAFDWTQESEWKISMVDSKMPKDAIAGALDESKTVGDYGLKKGDELHLWFTP